ncbi:MAG: APC family permease [Longimicrobiales bacterium]
MNGAATAPKAAALRRSMGPLQAFSLVVGIIIGASIFVQPSEITTLVPWIPGILLAWTVAGLLTLAGALICAELTSAFPRAGGVYAFLRETLSPVVGFLWGWAMFWSVHTGIIAAVAFVFARYAMFFLPVGEAAIPVVAIGAVALVSAVNYVGVQYGGRVQSAFTVVKVTAIALLIVAGTVLGARLPTHFVGSAAVGAGAVSAPAFIGAVAAGLFAFGGWHMIAYAAEETIDAPRTIPRALVAGILVVIACYILLNTVYLYVLPLDVVAQSSRVAADAADALVGAGGAGLMAALVVISAFGALNGLVLSGPRLYFAMAEDGLLFRWLAEVHPRYRTPHRALLMQAVWAAVLVATGTYRALFTRVVFTEWIFFALLAVGLVLVRRRSGYAPAYRVLGGWIVPAFFLLGSVVVVGNQLIAQPAASAVGLLFVATGVPVYFLWLRPRVSRRRVGTRRSHE